MKRIWFTRCLIAFSAACTAFGAGAALREEGIVWLHWTTVGVHGLLTAFNVFVLLHLKRKLH